MVSRFSAHCVSVLASLALATVIPVGSAISAQVASAQPRTQIVSISPLSLIFGLLSVEYERKLSSASALGASGSFYRTDAFSYTSAEGKYRYYPDGKALEGFAISGSGGLTRVGTRGDFGAFGETVDNESATAVTVGAAVDYQWLLGAQKKFAITLGLGARRLIFLGDGIDGAALTLPTARISIGRAF